MLEYLAYLNVADFLFSTDSLVAWFNDSRCVAGGVCPNDPFLFTCQIKDIIALRIVLPSGIQEVVSLSDTPTDVSLPAGFNVASSVVSDVNENSILYKLTISIANASLLNGGEIKCDDIIHRKVAEARCPLVGKKSMM